MIKSRGCSNIMTRQPIVLLCKKCVSVCGLYFAVFLSAVTCSINLYVIVLIIFRDVGCLRGCLINKIYLLVIVLNFSQELHLVLETVSVEEGLYLKAIFEWGFLTLSED